MIREKLLKFLLVLSDIIAINGAIFLAYNLRDKWFFGQFLDFTQPPEVYLKTAPFATILFLLLFRYFGLYALKIRLVKAEEVFAVFKAMALSALFLMAGSYLIKYDYSRLIVVLFFIFGFLLVNTLRYFIHIIQYKFIIFKNKNLRFLVVGSDELAKRVAHSLSQHKNFGFEVVGFFYFDHKADFQKQFQTFYKILEKEAINEVYFADHNIQFRNILTLISECPHRIKFKITSNFFKLLPGFTGLNFLDDIPELNIERQNPDFIYLFSKRLFDLIFSSVILILSLPFWLLIISAIKLESEGPAIIRQNRVGKDGKIFQIYKFRTMKSDTALYQYSPKDKNDERITKVGKFLRKFSLDEFPQFLNVIKGEMSVVGPRPEMPFIVEEYESWQKKRLMTKPGLTGLWQILGRKELPLHENLEYDFYYIHNQSFGFDLIIILKTIPAILWGRGAY